jgi:apolipoprotein N-acyltransferase
LKSIALPRFRNIYLALAAGILLFAAWPVSPLTFLIFLAFTPLLWLETRVKSRKHFFWLVYLAMFIWNISTTWWIWNASPPGAIAAFLANSFLMCFPWLGYKVVRKHMGEWTSYSMLVAFWMAFEYLHLHDWGLSWPWLTLGNVFATQPGMVQWYEFTGTSGGTFWVLASNILVFAAFREYGRRGRSAAYFFLLGGWLILLFAPAFYRGKELTGGELKTVVVVQPNIDPYEKISDEVGSFEMQLNRLITLSESKADSNTALFIWPETALYSNSRIEETTLHENFFLEPLWGFLRRHPGSSLFTGIESFRRFDTATKYSEEYNGEHYESYNGSVVMDSVGAKGFYHKSMLVPGVETLPWFLRFIDKWFEKFGGTTAGYARQDDRTVLNARQGIRIAPAICYESVYGEFMSRYIRKGANLICVITNDGWWGNTPGHKQHMNYARLRAIETRTWLARSANTGISCFISPSGQVFQALPWDEKGAIRMEIPINENSKPGFYVRYGDVLSLFMSVLAAGYILLTLFIVIKKKIRVPGKNKNS